MTKSEVQFWALFFALNFIFFLPGVFLHSDSEIIPIGEILAQQNLADIFKMIARRQNQDFLRLSLEFFVIIVMKRSFSALFANKNTLLSVLLVALLIYEVYHQSMAIIFVMPPLMYSDWQFIQTGAGIFISDFKITYLVVICGMLMVIFFLFVAFRYFLKTVDNIHLSWLSKSLLFGIFILMVLSSFYYKTRLGSNNTTVQSSMVKVFRNVSESIEAKKRFSRIDKHALANMDEVFSFELRSKPNLYFLFIESFGKVALSDSTMFSTIGPLLTEKQSDLTQSGWHVNGRYAISPVSGGGSWVSYASVMLGYNIENNGNYVTIMKDSLYGKEHHLFKFLASQGYRNFRLVPLPELKMDQIPWDRYTEFYGVDEWVKYTDLNIEGNVNTKLGWRGAPPDQYSLNYTYHHYLKEYSEPHSLFFITQNSHNPFIAPKMLSADWKNADVHEIGSADFFTKPEKPDYVNAISYEIDVVCQFIIENGSKNDIFFIIGDHQPPVITDINESLETPVFIISKNEKFVNGFSQYGFEPSLTPSESTDDLLHAGLHSILMRELQRNCGKDTMNLPPYFPDGYVF